jgi:hypothetical protein
MFVYMQDSLLQPVATRIPTGGNKEAVKVSKVPPTRKKVASLSPDFADLSGDAPL